jgi:hypothetical protein
LRFEVRYPTGARHEVELQGTLVVLGRDPSCDLVLNDVKCSRRHAVIEAGPQGLAIRDTSSANGIYVNGRRVERAALEPGDVVRLGEIVVKVMPEEVEGTLAMAPDELRALGAEAEAAGDAAARPAPSARAAGRSPSGAEADAPRAPVARPSSAAAPVGAIPRPLTVTLLAALWALAIPLYGVGGLMLGFGAGLARGPALAAATAGFLLAALAGVMAFGVWTRGPWARVVQLVLAAAGLLICPFALASITLLVYLLRGEARVHFSGRREYGALSLDERRLLDGDGSEPAFAGTLLGAVVLGTVLSIGAAFFVAPRLEHEPSADAAVLADLRALLSAQRNFREGTASACGLLYADLDGLLRPATVIPNYRPDGPAFLDPEFAQAVRGRYRFELAVSEPVAPAEGCPSRAFRSFRYAAAPLGGRGRHYLTGPDGKIHVAQDRPATFTDPTVE